MEFLIPLLWGYVFVVTIALGCELGMHMHVSVNGHREAWFVLEFLDRLGVKGSKVDPKCAGLRVRVPLQWFASNPDDWVRLTQRLRELRLDMHRKTADSSGPAAVE